MEYHIVSGLLTVAGSNLIFFNAVSYLGFSFVALMISLPPLLTYVGALLLRMERLCWWRATGVVLALIGSAFLVMRKWAAPESDPVWILVKLLTPILISAGKITAQCVGPDHGATFTVILPR